MNADRVFSDDEIKKRQEELARTTGTIIGTITDAATNKPLEMVHVSSQHMGDSTDESGFFRISYQKPGITEVTAYRRDLILYKTSVTVVAGKEVKVNFSMNKQQKACCKLEGKWEVALTYNKTTINGYIRFDSKIPDPLKTSRIKAHDDKTLDEFGRFDIDLRLLLGENPTSTGSTSILGGSGETVLVEADGYVHDIDSVEINLIPRMSHGGLTLSGKISNDTIKGEWHKREYAPTLQGTFIMHRMPP